MPIWIWGLLSGVGLGGGKQVNVPDPTASQTLVTGGGGRYADSLVDGLCGSPADAGG